jgi:hypothetical protein
MEAQNMDENMEKALEQFVEQGYEKEAEFLRDIVSLHEEGYPPAFASMLVQEDHDADELSVDIAPFLLAVQFGLAWGEEDNGEAEEEPERVKKQA